MQQVMIGSFLEQVKREVILEPDKKYKLLGVKWYGKGMFLREEKTGKEIRAKKLYQVKTGDFVYNRLFAWKSSFAIVENEFEGCLVSNEFPTFTCNKSTINARFLLKFVLQPDFIYQVNRLSGGMSSVSRKRYKEKDFLATRIPDYSLSKQNQIVNRVVGLEVETTKLESEISYQIDLLRKLRQQILQDAIEGKLTADWRKNNPDVEPASELLKRITAEKQQLIKDKKIRKQELLPPITDDEKPFSLPHTWVWCRLYDVITDTDSGWSPKCEEFAIQEGKWGVLKTTSVQHMKFLPDENKALPSHLEGRPNLKVKTGDILITRAGPANRVGICAMVKNTPDKLMLSDKIIRFHPLAVSGEYIELFIGGSMFQSLISNFKTGMAQSQVNISQANLKKVLIPLPSVGEQETIVSKVKKLLSICDQLETQIIANQAHTGQLLQAVLKEAFSQTNEKEKVIDVKPQGSIISFKPRRVDYYKRTLLAAEIINQLHTEPTLGHLKLQKLIFLCQKTQNMQIPTNFLQQAAGPYDPKMARSIDMQLRDKKWFEYKKNKLHKYQPLDNVGSHINDFERYFAKDLSAISHIIDLFRKAKSEELEIVATLYACWEELLQSGDNFTKVL